MSDNEAIISPIIIDSFNGFSEKDKIPSTASLSNFINPSRQVQFVLFSA